MASQDVLALCSALQKREKFVTISTIHSVDRLISEACALDPRIVASWSTWSGNWSKSSMLSLSKKYQLEFTYFDNIAANIDDVIVDDGTWRLSSFLASCNGKMPSRIHLVTKDMNRLFGDLESDMEHIHELFCGIRNLSHTYCSQDNSPWSAVWIAFEYVVPPSQYEMYQEMARRMVSDIDLRYLGGTHNMSKLLKVFLSFSYLQQTCQYDEPTAKMSESGQTPLNPEYLLPYGPLYKHRGICSSFAWAFKMMMDHQNIECRVISGEVRKDEDRTENHAWNLVKLNQDWYHVDVTSGISAEGVYIGHFLKRDIEMADRHVWDTTQYPTCNSTAFDYDVVENYIQSCEEQLLDYGIDERYLFPDEIRE